MKNIFYHTLTILVVLAISLSGCHNHDHGDHGHGHDHATTTDPHAGHGHGEEGHGEQEEGIHMSREQMKTMDVKLGEFSQVKINDFVAATGTMGLPPNAYSSVSAKTNGFIQNSGKFVEGEYIKKGTRIANLENPDLIQKQQEYLEIAAEMTYLQKDLNRQQKLVKQNAGVTKNVEKLQSEIKQRYVKMKGISKQLAYWGIPVNSLTPENILDKTPLVAPKSGYLTSIAIHNGMYVTPAKELMEIVSENHLHLELDVFEKDIAQVKENLPISYTVPALGNTIYKGAVNVIGREFDPENKTVRIHGHLDSKRPRFVKDLFVEAKIWLNDQTVQALPEKAIIKDGTSSYIYVANDQKGGEQVEFEMIRVVPGGTDKGFTAVKLIDEIPEGMQIVTEGAFFVYAQSKVGELEHSH